MCASTTLLVRRARRRTAAASWSSEHGTRYPSPRHPASRQRRQHRASCAELAGETADNPLALITKRAGHMLPDKTEQPTNAGRSASKHRRGMFAGGRPRRPSPEHMWWRGRRRRRVATVAMYRARIPSPPLRCRNQPAFTRLFPPDGGRTGLDPAHARLRRASGARRDKNGRRPEKAGRPARVHRPLLLHNLSISVNSEHASKQMSSPEYADHVQCPLLQQITVS